jgi:hypothetical protein
VPQPDWNRTPQQCEVRNPHSLNGTTGQLGAGGTNRHFSKIGGIRRMKLMEGREAGTEIIRVRTGAGLSFDAFSFKGLDISLTELWGTPISWQSLSGDTHLAFYEPEDTGCCGQLMFE